MKTFFLPILAMALGSFAAFGAPSLPDLGKDAINPDMGTAITVIFDNSGSMQGRKIDEAKTAFRAWLSKAPGTYIWSLIDFDRGGSLVIPFGKDQTKVADAISTLTARTNTPIVNALKIAARQIRERRAGVNPYERHLVLLFTDGQENQDPGGNGAVLATIREMRAANIEVVGIGYHGDGDYLGAASTHYFQADDVDALKAGLNKVDAEVDLGGEIKVTPEDLKAMGQLPPPPRHADIGAPDVPGPDGQPASAPVTSAATSSSPFPVKWIIITVVVLMIFRAFARK